MSRAPSPRAVMVLAGALALGACNRCGGRDEAQPQVVTEAEVPAPADLVADVVVATPNASWSKLQRGIGGAVGVLPPSFAGAMVLALGLDVALASEIDPTSPLYAVVAGDPTAPVWAASLRVSDPRHLRAVLAEGDTARFAAREVAGLVELVPREARARPGAESLGSARPATPAMGLTRGGYVVFATNSAELARLGPYATRTLTKRAVPETSAAVVDVPRDTIEKVIGPRLQAAWTEQRQALLDSDERMRRDHGGRAPDLGDPKAIVEAVDATFGKRLALFTDLEHVRFAIDVGDDDVRATATMSPRPGDGPATKWITGMQTGAGREVLGMPASSALAATLRATDEERATQGAAARDALLRAVAGKIAPADEKKVRDAFDAWMAGVGDTFSFAAGWEEPRGVFVRAAVRDRESATRAVRDAVELARVAPFDELLRVKSVAATTEEVPALGRVSLATFVREPARGATRPRPSPPRARGDAGAGGGAPTKDTLGVAWTLDGDTLALAAGSEPLVTLRQGGRPDRKLGDEAAVTRALSADAFEAVLVVQPLKLDPRRAPLPAAPLVVTLGRDGKDAVLRLSVSDDLLREAPRLNIAP